MPRLITGTRLENFYQLTGQAYSGATPASAEAFDKMQKLGIKTIISVDGARPDVETARKYGMRYVHLPIGYNGVPANRAAELVQAAKTLPAPIYVHCHHGKHRGPAAAALLCLSAAGWTPQEALDWLKQAGTATNYAGLYQTVREFTPPTADALANVGNLPERNEVSPLVDAMVEIDERFENLKLVKAAGYKQPPSHPDISPEHEALLLHELYLELHRSAKATKEKPDFLREMERAEKCSAVFRAALGAYLKAPAEASLAQVDQAWNGMGDSCGTCHKAFRN